jgi:hemolysin activation/secretion protein
MSEIVTVSLNNRVRSPSLPADSRSTGLSLSLPIGWWTFGAGARRSRYRQHIRGEVAAFDMDGQFDAISGWAERVLHRSRRSRTAARVTVQRRWSRSAIDGVEIGLQHQDVADLELALIHHRQLADGQVDLEVAQRHGVPWFGAQVESPNRPVTLPTARYRITVIDLSVSTALGPLISYHSAFRGQISRRPLYGADQIAVGGPFTVRGVDANRALAARSGWYFRQEFAARFSDRFSPYILADAGQVRGAQALPLGVGAGVRTRLLRANLDAWVALPVTASRIAGPQLGQIGLAAGWVL